MTSQSQRKRPTIARNIDMSLLPERERADAIEIARELAKAGARAFIVGGAVRDLALSTPVKDVDIEVFGLGGAQVQDILSRRWRLDLVGQSFGVIKLHHSGIDVSLPRRETKTGAGHKAFDIDSDPTMDVDEAARRRDFTINAMYFDPLAGELIDPYGGSADLENGILRHVSERFREDPLRVLRGMQFVARFDLDPAPETVEICRSMTPEDLPPERLFEEFAKLFTKGVKISKGMEFLRSTGWVRHFPELSSLIGLEQDPKWHPEGDVWNHTCLALDAFARNRTGDRYEDIVVGLAVMAHDFGKATTTVHDADGHIRSRGHDVAGVKPTLSFIRRLTNEERILKDVPPLVSSHMQPFALWKAKAGDSAVRRLALKVGRIDRLLRVAHADDEGRTPGRLGGSSLGEDLKWLDDAARRLRIEAEAPKPILMGRHLIELGLKPGPGFSKILSKVFEAQLDGAFSDLDGAIAYLMRRWNDVLHK